MYEEIQKNEKKLYKALPENAKSYGIINKQETNIYTILEYNSIDNFYIVSETQNFIDMFSQKNILN